MVGAEKQNLSSSRSFWGDKMYNSLCDWSIKVLKFLESQNAASTLTQIPICTGLSMHLIIINFPAAIIFKEDLQFSWNCWKCCIMYLVGVEIIIPTRINWYMNISPILWEHKQWGMQYKSSLLKRSAHHYSSSLSLKRLLRVSTDFPNLVCTEWSFGHNSGCAAAS